MELENKLKALEELTAKMESGVSLDEGIKLFEQGLELAKQCMGELKEYNGKLNEIKKSMDELLDE